MPSPLTSNPSSSVAKTSSANAINNLGAAAPILQGLMEGQGWRDQRGEILERDQQSALAIGRIKQAAADYDAAPTNLNRTMLIAAIKEELNIAHTEYNYAKSQQQYYAKETAREAKAQAGRQQGWGEWLMGGVKSFFGSTTEQQVEKYAEIAQKRQALADQLQQVLTQLTAGEKEAKSVKPEEEPVEIVSALTKKTRMMSQASDNEAMPQFHSRRLLQSNATNFGEFRVNTNTTNDQTNPRVATLNSGDFVITWGSDGQDGGNYGIYAQRYTASGIVQGAEFQVNIYTINDQRYPNIATLASGDFVIVWESAQGSNGYEVYARRYNASGIAQGAEFRVNVNITDDQRSPDIAALSSGGFVVTWDSLGQDGDGKGVYARRFNANGTAQDPQDIQVNTYTLKDQGNPHVAVLSSGGFVVVWQSLENSVAWKIYARRYNANAVSLDTSEFLVSNANATLSSQTAASIVALNAGNFVISWGGYDADDTGVFARRYNASGVPQDTPEFLVNTYTAGEQYAPSVARLTSGDFVIAWRSMGSDGNSYGVSARRFSAIGVPQSTEFQVNTFTVGGQMNPSVAALANGSFVITWQDDGHASGFDIFARLFSAPVFISNRLNISEGGSVIFTNNQLSADDSDSTDSSLSFTISNLQHGWFQRVSNNSALTQFTQQDVINGEVRFTHDSSKLAPTYNVTLTDGQFVVGPSSSTIAFNQAPVLTKNSLALDDAATVTVNSSFLSATDDQTNATDLNFLIGNIQHGRFELNTSPGVNITQFTQEKVQSNQVRFVHDGSNVAPNYTVSVSDGILSTPPSSAVITFNESPLLSVNNQVPLNDSGIALMTFVLSATDDRTSSGALNFTVSNIQHGHFELTTSPGVNITQFTQGQVQLGRVRFVHDGSNLAPTYQVSVSDGILTTLPVDASFNFNGHPYPNPLPLSTKICKVNAECKFLVPDDTFIDPEGQTLNWVKAHISDKNTLPDNWLFDSPSHTFTGQIITTGNWNITLQVTDPGGLSAWTTFLLQVGEALQSPCEIAGMSKYTKDSVTCNTVRGAVYGLPSFFGTVLLTALGAALRKKQVNDSWAEKRYQIHNVLRRELRLSVGLLDSESSYENTIYSLIGRLLGITHTQGEKEAEYNHRVGREVKKLSTAEGERYGLALVAAIRDHVHFPDLYCDREGRKQNGETKAVMPIQKYFYEIVPLPSSCLTTYKFRPNVLLEEIGSIIASARLHLTGSQPAEEKTAAKSGCCGSVMSFFYRRDDSKPRSRTLSSPHDSKAGVEMEVLSSDNSTVEVLTPDPAPQLGSPVSLSSSEGVDDKPETKRRSTGDSKLSEEVTILLHGADKTEVITSSSTAQLEPSANTVVSENIDSQPVGGSTELTAEPTSAMTM